MNKYIITTALILTLINVPSAKGFDGFEFTGNGLGNGLMDMFVQDEIYESPTALSPATAGINDKTVYQENEDEAIVEEGDAPVGSRPKFGKDMPMFKRARIKMMNHFRRRNIEKTQKLIDEWEKSVQSQDKETEIKDNGVGLLDEIEENTIPTSSEVENSDGKSIQLTGEVKEQITTNDVILDADHINFDDKTMDVTATGHPVLEFPPQETTIKADKIVYNNVTNVIKAYDNVRVIKQGSVLNGDFIQINMNEENAFIDMVDTIKGVMRITARKATANDKEIVLSDGKLTSTGDFNIKFRTSMVGGFDYSQFVVDDIDRSFVSDFTGSQDMNVNVKEITVDAKKKHNVLTLKGIEIYNGKRHLFDISHFEAHTNKNSTYFEGNYPEIGSRNPMGLYFGPGYVFDIPNGATLKAIPVVNYKNKWGIGGVLRYKSPTNITDLMYGSANDVFVIKGKQYLDDKFYLQYGTNAYMNEWFMGARLPKYAIEAIYEDNAVVKNLLGDGLNLTFKNRFGLGYFGDAKYQLKDEHLPQGREFSLRLRYMAEANQTLLKYKNKEKKFYADLSLVGQGSAAVYGAGETQFVGRVGPRLRTQYKYWMQNIGYFATAYEDHTPLLRYDTFRYGHANVYLNEALRLNKWLAVGWSINANLLKDSPNGKMLQENAFIVSLGPDEFKVNLGYDFVRERTYFNIIMGMNVKNSSVNYKKLVIKNPDRLSGNGEPELKLLPTEEEYFKPAPSASSQTHKQYAEVIEIQDPEREYIQ